MKKSVGIIALILVVTTLVAFAFAGCDLTRKMKGAEMTFPGKISDSAKLSFKMNINYKKGETTTVIDMDCFRAKNEAGENEYAYVYTTAGARYASYKNIYADGKLYEIVDISNVAGTYYIKDNVPVDDNGNILYHITQKILLTGVAAFLSKGQKETLNGEEVYRYEISINGKKVSLWYNSEVLVKVYVYFPAEEEGGEAEQYTIHLSDYHFDEELPANTFKRPDTYGITYVHSPMSVEDWMSIITGFAGKFA